MRTAVHSHPEPSRAKSESTDSRVDRLLRARWHRFTHFEFWPWWVFYAPVVAYVLVRLVPKYRSFTTFVAANPAIPTGGLLGESKAAILSGLNDNGGRVASWILLSPSGDAAERVAVVCRWMEKENLHWPIVLKPDIGERGTGVAIVNSRIEAEEYLANSEGAIIAQVFVGGREYGVFYVRRPHESKGRVLSITGKRWPSVVGDGRRTLEELILRDARAVLMADFFLRKFHARLREIPVAGEVILLTEIGNHCRGAVFLNLSWAVTPELEAAIDEVAQKMKGFHLGRFDLRVPTLADLRRGEEFKVLELNGVASEQSHIYDPNRLSVWRGWRVMMLQWRLAFEIGAENLARGASRGSLWAVVKAVLQRNRRFAPDLQTARPVVRTKTSEKSSLAARE